jgi:DNA-binding NarL/FixJ family response regulator
LLEITWDALLIEELLPAATPFALASELHKAALIDGGQLGKLVLTSVALSGATRILAIESGFGACFEVADGLGALIEACEVLVDGSTTSFAPGLVSAHQDLRADSARAGSDLALIESVDDISRKVLARFAEGLSDKAISVEVSISQARVRQTIGELCSLLDVPTREALTWRMHLLGFGPGQANLDQTEA